MPEIDAEAERLAREVVSGLRKLLGAEFIGAYLYGSAVSGGFDPGVSDLDLVAVTGADAADLDLHALDRVHADLLARHEDWTDRLEVAYVGRDALASFRSTRASVAVISPGEPFHLRAEPVGDWVQNWYLVRETGVVLHGPPAATVIPPIAWSEFVVAAAHYADEITGRDLAEASGGSLAYAVLTMSRALMTVESDRHTSKQEAATWVQSQLPEWADLVDAALRCRLDRGTIGFDDPTTRTTADVFIGVLAARIRAAS